MIRPLPLPACVVCYPTELAVAQRVADYLGVRAVASEYLPATGRFYIMDPSHELDPAMVAAVAALFA